MELAFESFRKVDPQWLGLLDNHGFCALDIVWCYYMDQDLTNLSTAGQMLKVAEVCLERAHGKDLSRLKAIRGNFMPEIALYVRLNILRAYQAYYNQNGNAAHTHLMKAEMDLRKLQISDDSLAVLSSMGFGFHESRRALRFCAGDVNEALSHIERKRVERAQKQEEERQRLRDRAIQKRIGLTQNGKFVDLKLVRELQNFGVDREIAIEALRQTDNNGESTLDLCTDPQRREILAQTLFARHFNDKELNKIEQILGLIGPENVTESRVRAALFLKFNNVEEAVNLLTAPQITDIVDLDRIEVRFVPYVQERQQRLMRKQQREEEERKKQMEMEQDGNENEEEPMNGGGNGTETVDEVKQMDVDDDDNDNDDGKNGGDVVEAAAIPSQAMPNPDLGDVHVPMEQDIVNNLVDDFQPIQRKQPDEDDMKIEQHILDDLSINDEDAYLDIELHREQEALDHLRVLLNTASSQDNKESFLTLFNQ